MEKVVVIWMGYVGFPLACAIAKSEKYNVHWLDTDISKIESIQNRTSPVEDTKAEEDIKTVDLKATTDNDVLIWAKYILITVPTPVLEDKEPDLTPLLWVCNILKDYLNKWMYVVVESTINPWVCEEILEPVLEESWLKSWVDFELSHCPERINPGDPKWNVYNISRNIWAKTKEWTKVLADFYRSFLEAEVNEMQDIKHAEATKIIENTFRDINIAYVNELAKSFDRLWLDINEVIWSASNKPFAFLPHYPWCGIGGHCIPVDPYYLIKRAKKEWFDHKFLINAREINNSMPEYLVEKLILALNDKEKSIKWTKIALFGLSYKKDIWDLRESPALEIKAKLETLWADLTVYDPFVSSYDEGDYMGLVREHDVLVYATNHSLFKEIEENLHELRWKVIVDGRNFLDKEKLLENWVYYSGIGR